MKKSINLSTILDIIGKVKTVIDVIIPILESIIGLDLNNDGVTGRRKTEKLK